MTASRAPRARGNVLFGSFLDLKKDPLELFTRIFRECGDVAAFRLVYRDAHLISHPDGIERVLVGNHRNYSKNTPGQVRLREFLGQGLLTSEGSFWLRQRRIAQPAFHREKIAGFAATMARAARETVAGWDAAVASGEPVDLTADMTRLTLRIAAETLLGVGMGGREADEVGAALSESLRQFQKRVASPLTAAFSFLPTSENRALANARASLDRIVLGVIAARRKSSEESGDLLSMLMHARDEETGEGMSDGQLRDEVMTLFLAGFETTANALNWTWYLLSRHPEAAERLRRETFAVLGGREPRLEDLPKLPYSLAVVKESMRLCPPAWILVRRAEEEDRIGEFLIPKGALVMMSPYVTHRHPSFWKEPDRFDPARFENDAAEGLPRYAYFPFGGGPRQCIGNMFALMEAQIVVATIAQNRSLELVADRPVGFDPTITLRPKPGLRARVRQR